MGNNCTRRRTRATRPPPLPPPPGDPIRGREVEARQIHNEREGRAEIKPGALVVREETREVLQRIKKTIKITNIRKQQQIFRSLLEARQELQRITKCYEWTHKQQQLLNALQDTERGRDEDIHDDRAEGGDTEIAGVVATPINEDGAPAIPIKKEGPVAIPLKEDNTPVPLSTTETLPIPVMRTTLLPTPSNKTQALPVPRRPVLVSSLSKKTEILPPPSRAKALLPPLSKRKALLPPQSRTTEPLPPSSRTTEPLPPPSKTTELLPPPARTTEPVPPPARTTDPLPPPARTKAPLPPLSRTMESLPPLSKTTKPLPPPSKTTEPVPPLSRTTKLLPPPSRTTKPLPPPSRDPETLLRQSRKSAQLPHPVKEDDAVAPPFKNSATATPVKEDDTTATSIKENSATATPVREDDTAATSFKENSATATPVKEDDTAATSFKENSATPTPIKEDDATATFKENSAAVTSAKDDGTGATRVKENGADGNLVKETGATGVPIKEDNATTTQVKENYVPGILKEVANATSIKERDSAPSKVSVGGNTNNKAAGKKKVGRRPKKPKHKSPSTLNLIHPLCRDPRFPAATGKHKRAPDSLAEARNVRPWKEVKRSYDVHLFQIRKRAEDAVAKHYDKTVEVEEQLEALQQGRKNLSMEEFVERLKSHRALEDRLQELGLQKDEFLRHMEDVLEQLQAARTTQDFEPMAIELRKNMATECGRLANAFPIYARRTDIVTTVRQYQVCVIIGETGSGKSTQMAQFFLQEGVAGDGTVACTQPRKIAATSLATHVAREMGSEVGRLVGYKVGMHARRTDTTKILYMTDHVLLNECLQDPTLARYSCVIIDEAHERSIYTDLLLGMLRNCLRTRPELRIVITSATIKPDVFVRYFGKCPVVRVSGRMFPVEVEWQETQTGVDSFKNYQEAAVRKAVKVHRHEGQGDVLVFLTSPAETERCCQMFRDHLEGHPEDYVVQQLHGRLQSDEQQQVFDPAPEGRRKVVFATNSAETSVTIPGVKFVIDTGLVKEMKYDPVRRINSLTVTLVSQSSARQRQGRAGRLGPGKCFRLYTEQDYSNMAPDSLPEILKVHVGHAMLKLMELGVDPMQFEYIESPSREALEEALASLVALGAVAEGRITDLGKWVAKMPFDPRYGVLVHDAVRAGAGLEAIVVAATSGSGSVFYRGGSLMEKEAADKKKVSFCHEGGDQLTALNVFRAWHQVAERNQGRWCLNHAINGKTMRTVQETTREVLHTLDKELHACIPFKFGDTRTIDTILQGLLFRALKSNLSHYLGHPKAGYAPAFKEHRVELHPSCALLPLGRQPEWLVFEQVMRTSRDFAMQVTPVEESVVLQAVQDGWLQLDLEAAKKKRLVAACHETVGPQLFREVVGPRYSLLRAFEEKLAAAHPGCVVVVEAMEEKGVLRVLSSQQHLPALADSFTDIVPPLRAMFRAEESEETVGKRSQHGGVRAVVGAGGVVTDLLMPEEYTTVMVNCCRDAVDRLSEGEVALALGKHGAIKECIKFFRKNNNSTLWGKVVFRQREAAAAAVQETYDKQKDRQTQQEDADGQGMEKEPDDLQLNVRPNVRAAWRRDAAFTAKIQWCRRPSRGFGYVSFANVEDFMQAQTTYISVGGFFARVKPARRDEQTLYVSKFGSLVTEDVLRAAFAEELNLHPTRDLTKVVVVREHRALDPEHRRTCERRLRHRIEEFAPREGFRLEVCEPRSDRDVNYVGFCNFNSPEQGHAACAAIDNNFSMNFDTKVSMRPDIRSSIFVHADMYALCGPQVEELVKELEGDQVRLKVKKLKNDNVIVELHSNSVAALAHVRSRLQEVVTGDVVECGNSPAAVALFSREGKRLLKEVMDRTHTLVLTDNRLKTVSIHGPAPQRQAAREQIMEQMQLLTGHRKYVQLRDGGRPRGLMKALMMKYGTDLEALRDMARLGAVTLDLRYHRLGLCGSRQAVEKASQAVEAVAAGLPQEEAADPADDQPECAACLCPVEDGTLCRLECCGHAYCRECLAQQVSTAVTSRAFPVECVKDGCGAPLVWRDFVNLSRCGQLTQHHLVEAAVAAHVQAHQRSLHYCITPDCPAVYRTSEQGALFVCPECEARACTACHVQYHEGLTCAMYRSAGKDTGLGNWLGQDTYSRKICPNCTTPIEKVEGCNKVSCIACKKVLCWVCLAVFPSDDECYRHLRNEHGGY